MPLSVPWRPPPQSSGDKPIAFSDKRTLRKHLKDVHHDDLHLLTDAQLEDLDIYLRVSSALLFS